MTTTKYIYLHGFASSPNSAKAQYINDRFDQISIPLSIPDLNQSDFLHLTLSRQIEQVSHLLGDAAVTLIGSSFGGLTAAWLAQRYRQIERLILLAPAFGFLSEWLNRLGQEIMGEWKSSGYLKVYHYGEKRSLPLQYQFVLDLEQYPNRMLQRSIPTLIVHGQQDEVIPVRYIREYALHRSWVNLVEVDSDHALADVMPEIWDLTKNFCNL